LWLPFRVPVPADINDQLVRSLKMQWARDVGEARISLDPRRFGDVSVTVRVEAGRVVAHVQAEVAAVREWLQANQHLFQESLAGHDLRLDRLDVTAPAEDERGFGRRDRRDRRQDEPTPDPRRQRRGGDSPVFTVVA
jgi:flagellar hook-length control protein FliK